MAKQAAELRYAVRPSVILKYFGQLSLVLAALTTAPLAIALLLHDGAAAIRLAIVTCGLAAIGAVLTRLKTPSSIQPNEGMVLVAIMFLFAPLAMSYPLMTSGMNFIDAFFETVSGVTTTGLSTRSSVENSSAAFLFLRSWMQWYGGLGIVAFSLALLGHSGLVVKGLSVSEDHTDDLIGGTKAHMRRVLEVYGILTGIGVIGLLLIGVRPFDAVLYILSTVSTGGFSPHDNSLASLSLPAQTWIILVCLASATPLLFYYKVFRQRRHLSVDLLQILAVIIAAVTVSTLLIINMRLFNNMDWPQILHQAPLLAFSAQTTTGFYSLPCTHLDTGSKTVLVFSMLLGGGIGSTAGGFKVLRLLIFISILRLTILQTSLPAHAVIEPRLAKQRLEEPEIRGTMLLILLFIVLVALSWLPFVMMGYDPLNSLFEVVSAVATTGLSAGLTNSNLPVVLKIIICIDMLMGRLEIIAWIVLLYPGTWFGKRMEQT
jgi:trk system potassium uptake protein TrkH